MPRAHHILIVANDLNVGRWLQHRVESLAAGHLAELDDQPSFERRLAATSAAGVDAVLALLDFSPGADASGFDWLEQMMGIPDMPPIVVVAEHGTELVAVSAIRRGAADYVPRDVVDGETLGNAIETACAAGLYRRRTEFERSRATIDALPDPLKVPRDLIPRYSLLDVLGKSPRTSVYLAHSAALERNVALKVSRVSEDGQPQFAREFATAGALRHPGIVDIYDYGVHDGREFIAMEYFPCGDLKARLHNPVTVGEALLYVGRIAGALAAVHGEGVLHRDLKPANIMLRDDGDVVLIDFGLARSLDGGAGSTRAGVLRGSPYYMSPEQAQGLELDARSDLYSLGVILFEMLTGVRPYLGESAIEVLNQHVNAALPELPAHLAAHQPLLDGLLAKDREDRCSSAGDLLALLHHSEAA